MYELVTWPESQMYMSLDDFRKNACLADSDEFVDTYGSAAYFINVEWKKQADVEIKLQKELNTTKL